MKSPSFLLPLVALALTAPLRAQSTWYVDVDAAAPGDGSQASPYQKLRYCFAQSSTVAGDTVLVLPGIYAEDLDLFGKALDVRSTGGVSQTTLMPASEKSVLRAVGVNGGRLEGFLFRDGRGSFRDHNTWGGGVDCRSSALEFTDCEFRANHAGVGGAICATLGSTVTLNACRIASCEAYQGGGIYAEASTVVAFDTIIEDNHAVPIGAGQSISRRGAGICTAAGATLELYDSQVLGCSPGGPHGGFTGGGLYLGGNAALLEDCLVANCGELGIASSSGGGIAAPGGAELIRCTIRDNVCRHAGGGVTGPATLEDCDLIANRSGVLGGAARGTTSLVRCRILDNRAGTEPIDPGSRGGGVHSAGVLVDCLLEGNRCAHSGGAAFSSTLVDCVVRANRVEAESSCALALSQSGGGLASCTATDCLLEDNRVVGQAIAIAASEGGGAYSSSLTGCTLRGNRVDISQQAPSSFPQRGGGASNSTLVDCAVEANEVQGWMQAAVQGGGVSGGAATSCVLSGNRALSLNPARNLSAGGGAAAAVLVGCQVFDNAADHGGGAWQCDLERCTVVGNLARESGGALSVHPAGAGGATWGAGVVVDTIAWGNLPDELEVGTGSIVATFSDVEGGYPGTGNLALDPLFWNEEQGDLHLRAGSPCIDAGDPNAPLDPDGSGRDMGALPFDATHAGGPYLYCEAKTTSQGCLPAIASTGSPTLTGPDDFVVSVSEVVQNQSGVLFWGSAPAAAPFMGGLRCVANPVLRTPVSNSAGSGACGGVLSFAFTQSYLANQALQAGDRLFAQFWFRDPTQPDGTGVGLSGGIDFTVWP